MEEEDTWGLGIQNGGCDAQYEEVQDIFFEQAAGEIPVFGGVLVLGFDLLGEFVDLSFLLLPTLAGISTGSRSHSRLDRRRNYPRRSKTCARSHCSGGEATYLLGTADPKLLHEESIRDDVDQSDILLHPYPRLDCVPHMAFLLHKRTE